MKNTSSFSSMHITLLSNSCTLNHFSSLYKYMHAIKGNRERNVNKAHLSWKKEDMIKGERKYGRKNWSLKTYWKFFLTPPVPLKRSQRYNYEKYIGRPPEMVKVGHIYCLNGPNNHSPFCARLGFSPNDHSPFYGSLGQHPNTHSPFPAFALSLSLILTSVFFFHIFYLLFSFTIKHTPIFFISKD